MRDYETVLHRTWDAALNDLKERGHFPIRYRSLREHMSILNENYHTELFGMPVALKVTDLGYQELFVKVAFNPPAHWPNCPDHVTQLAKRSKKTDLLFFQFWKPSRSEEVSRHTSCLYGSIRTFDKILLI